MKGIVTRKEPERVNTVIEIETDRQEAIAEWLRMLRRRVQADGGELRYRVTFKES